MPLGATPGSLEVLMCRVSPLEKSQVSRGQQPGKSKVEPVGPEKFQGKSFPDFSNSDKVISCFDAREKDQCKAKCY